MPLEHPRGVCPIFERWLDAGVFSDDDPNYDTRTSEWVAPQDGLELLKGDGGEIAADLRPFARTSSSLHCWLLRPPQKAEIVEVDLTSKTARLIAPDFGDWLYLQSLLYAIAPSDTLEACREHLLWWGGLLRMEGRQRQSRDLVHLALRVDLPAPNTILLPEEAEMRLGDLVTRYRNAEPIAWKKRRRRRRRRR